MAEKIRINTKTLQSDTTSILKYLKQVEERISDMQREVSELNQMWSGDANQAFNQAFQTDIQSMLEICKGIQGIITYEITAKTEYDNCENKVASMIAAMKV